MWVPLAPLLQPVWDLWLQGCPQHPHVCHPMLIKPWQCWCTMLQGPGAATHSISHLLKSLCSPYRLFKLSSLFHTPLNTLESASYAFVFSITVLGHIPSDVWSYLLTYTYLLTAQPSLASHFIQGTWTHTQVGIPRNTPISEWLFIVSQKWLGMMPSKHSGSYFASFIMFITPSIISVIVEYLLFDYCLLRCFLAKWIHRKKIRILCFTEEPLW